jgi:hypothetical protein
MNKRHENLLSYFWVLIILSPFIVGFIVSIRIVNITTSNDWIGFYAVIIGGLITYFSIYISMNGVRSQVTVQEESNNLMKIQLDNEKIKIKEERRLNVRPYINEYSGNINHSINYLSVIFEKHQLEDHAYQDDMVIRIKNIGLGPMISFRVVGLIDVGSDLYSQFNDEIKSLEKEGVMELKISYLHSGTFLSNTYRIVVEYFDILDNLYSQTITIVALKEDQAILTKVLINNISKQELKFDNQ